MTNQSDPINTFNNTLEELVANKQYQAARGTILSAILMAQTDPSAPEEILPRLIVSYTQILDREVQDIIAHAKAGLMLLGVGEAEVREALAFAAAQTKDTGANNGTAH